VCPSVCPSVRPISYWLKDCPTCDWTEGRKGEKEVSSLSLTHTLKSGGEFSLTRTLKSGGELTLTHTLKSGGEFSLTHTLKWGGEFSLTHALKLGGDFSLIHSLKWEGEFIVTHSPMFIYMCKRVYLLVPYAIIMWLFGCMWNWMYIQCCNITKTLWKINLLKKWNRS
jgi:hypothetical protein